MNLSEFQLDRASFPQELLSTYQLCWVAFRGDGKIVLASGKTLDEVEDQLAALGEDPQEVFMEYIGGPEENIIMGGGDLG